MEVNSSTDDSCTNLSEAEDADEVPHVVRCLPEVASLLAATTTAGFTRHHVIVKLQYCLIEATARSIESINDS